MLPFDKLAEFLKEVIVLQMILCVMSKCLILLVANKNVFKKIEFLKILKWASFTYTALTFNKLLFLGIFLHVCEKYLPSFKILLIMMVFQLKIKFLYCQRFGFIVKFQAYSLVMIFLSFDGVSFTMSKVWLKF